MARARRCQIHQLEQTSTNQSTKFYQRRQTIRAPRTVLLMQIFRTNSSGTLTCWVMFVSYTSIARAPRQNNPIMKLSSDTDQWMYKCQSAYTKPKPISEMEQCGCARENTSVLSEIDYTASQRNDGLIGSHFSSGKKRDAIFWSIAYIID